MNRIGVQLLVVALSTTCLLTNPSQAQQAQPDKPDKPGIVLQVDGLKTSKGTVHCALFDKAKGFPS